MSDLCFRGMEEDICTDESEHSTHTSSVYMTRVLKIFRSCHIFHTSLIIHNAWCTYNYVTVKVEVV